MNLRFKFAGDAVIYTISNFAVAGVPFLLMPVLTRVLTPQAYGIIAMFNVVVSLLAVFIGLNVHGAIMVRFFQKRSFHLPDYVATCLLILAITASAMCGVICLFGDFLVKATAIPLHWLLIAALVASFQFVVQTLLTLWQASNKPRQFGALRISQAVADGSISIVMVVVLSLSWQGRISGIALAWAFTAAFAIWLLAKNGWVSRSPNVAYAKDALRYGVPLLPHALGAVLLGMVDRFLVTNLLDVGSTGLYVVAAQCGMVLGIAADALNRAFAPWLMGTLQASDISSKRQIVRYTYFYFASILFIALAGTILAPFALSILVGPRYHGIGPIIGYFLFGNAFMGMYYMVTHYVFIAGRTELLSGLTATVGSAATAFTWLLITKNGIAGAAQGYMFGQAFLFLGTWLIASYCYPMPWRLAVRHYKQE